MKVVSDSWWKFVFGVALHPTINVQAPIAHPNLQPLTTIPRQLDPLPCPIYFVLCVAPPGIPRTVQRQPGLDDGGTDVLVGTVTGADEPVISLLAAQLAADRPVQDEVDHELLRLQPQRLFQLRCGDTVQPHRHFADLDGIAVADVADSAS